MQVDGGTAALRRRRVWEAARAAGHDALIIAGRGSPGEYGMYQYVTGARPPHRPAYAVLVSGGPLSVVVPTPAEAAALDERAVPVAGIGRGDAAATALADAVAAAGPLRSVGIAGLDEVVPVLVRDRLRALLPPDVALVDATGVVSRAKAVPDDDVITGLHVVAGMAERGLRRFRALARPGRSCRELAAEVERELWIAGACAGFAYVGPGEPTAAGSPAAPLRDGDLVTVVIEVAGPSGEWVEVGVLHGVGTLAPPARQLAAAALGALVAGADALRPGSRAGDVARAIERAIARTPLASGTAHGHGVGIDADEPVIEAADARPLRAGAGVALHPALQHRGRPAPCVINTYVVGADGAWPLLARPHALHTIGGKATTRRSSMTTPLQVAADGGT